MHTQITFENPTFLSACVLFCGQGPNTCRRQGGNFCSRSFGATQQVGAGDTAAALTVDKTSGLFPSSAYCQGPSSGSILDLAARSQIGIIPWVLSHVFHRLGLGDLMTRSQRSSAFSMCFQTGPSRAVALVARRVKKSKLKEHGGLGGSKVPSVSILM